jgi:uncharacterized protein (DUF4415 family)
MKKSVIVKPTRREDRAIKAGISRDPDTYELKRREFTTLRPVVRGRPRVADPKIPVTVRLDPDVVAFFRNSGRGWQTRLNAALSDYVGKRRKRA